MMIIMLQNSPGCVLVRCTGGIRPSTTIRYVRKRHRIGEFAHLLGFVEPVDLIEEYDCLSTHLGVRLVA